MLVNYPNGPEDHAGIVSYANAASTAARSLRLDIDRDATRNVLGYLGVQWITFDVGNRSWRPLALKRTTPRPVTNKLAAIVNNGVSQLVGFKPPITYGPASMSEEDMAAAGVADKINTIIEKESGIRYQKPLIARWLWLTGNVFLVSDYDVSFEHGQTFVQHFACAVCGTPSGPADIESAGGACPACQSAPFAGAPAQDAYGQPVGTNYPEGRFHTSVESVFSVYFDPESQPIDDSPYFMLSKTYPRSWVAERYGQAVADSSPSQPYVDPFKFYLETLAYTTASSGRSVLGAGPRLQDRIRVRRLWIRPNMEKAPEGIHAILIGDQVQESGPWPYKDQNGRPFLNVTHIQFDQVPGRTLAKTRVDDLWVKQRQRNELESILQLHAIRCANAIWLVPEGAGIQRITGEQGQIIRYTPTSAGNEPRRISGDPGPAYIIQWIEMIDAEMDAIAGLNEVSRGEVPRGVTAYAALQFLDERSQQGLSNLMDNWSTGFMDWSRKNLNIWRSYADRSRYLAQSEGGWSVSQFDAAQLQGGVDMDVELGQNRPRTLISRRATAEQAVRLALVNVGDPAERFRLLEVIGLPEMMEDYKADFSKASRENDTFMHGQVPPPSFPWDNAAVHISVHRRFLISEQGEALPPPLRQALIQHTLMDYRRLQTEMLTQGPGQIAPRGAPAGPGDGAMLQAEAQAASPEDFNAAPSPAGRRMMQRET